MEQRKKVSINLLGGWNNDSNSYEQYPGRYDQSWLKERIFQGMHPFLRDFMRFLYMKEDVGYEEFLATVYEAEMEGSEGKVLNVKVKAITVEKITDNKEQNELKDLRQQIELLATIMKSATLENVKPKSVEGVSSPGKKEVLEILLGNSYKDHLKKGKDL